MFHELRGKNVILDPSLQVATWHPVRTGGCLFTEHPLCENQTVVLTLNGSGGVELGILGQDPASLRDSSLLSSTAIQGYQFLNDVKIHKRSCSMKFGINTTTKEVTSSYGDGHYSQRIQPEGSYWLAIDVKYGEVELKLENQENDNYHQNFSTVHGNNIQLLNDPTVARSCQRSPAALCFYKEPVHKGLRLTLHCTPKAHQGMVPGRYYVQLMYTTVALEQLKESNPDLFDVSCKKQSDAIIKKIEKFEKEDFSSGPIVLNFTDNDLVYTASSGKVNTQAGILSSGKDTWLVFELYGVELKLSATGPSTTGPSVSGNVVDARAMPPRQNSAAYFEVSPENHDITPDEERLPDNDFINIPQATQQTVTERQHTTGLTEESSSSASRSNQDTDDICNLEESIRKSWIKLNNSFVAKEFVDYMYEDGLLTLGQMEELQPNCPSREVLRILSRRPVRKKFMLNALDKTKQRHLECFFFPEEEKE